MENKTNVWHKSEYREVISFTHDPARSRVVYIITSNFFPQIPMSTFLCHYSSLKSGLERSEIVSKKFWPVRSKF